MSDQVFAIDFGSSFTKVALRPDLGEESRLLDYPDYVGDSLHSRRFSVPSIVSAQAAKSGTQYLCGRRAYELVDKASTFDKGELRVYANWKKWAFLPPEATHPVGLDALVQSPEFVALARRYQVPANQVKQLGQLVQAARGLFGVAPPIPKNIHVQQAMVLAEKFFAYVRSFVLAECERLTTAVTDPGRIPAVLTVPAFGSEDALHESSGAKLLTGAMEKAGWVMRSKRPVVSEPYSNAIGVLTRGRNSLTRNKINLGKMFSKGPLITAMVDGKYHPLYRAVVIDVGAFTTDIAAVELPTYEDGPVVNPDEHFRVATHSITKGVSDLDKAVEATLPAAKAEWLRSAFPYDRDEFKKSAYTDGKPFGTVEVGSIGTRAELPAILQAITDFANGLVAELNAFCGKLPPSNMQELIITGGGSNIPGIRDVLEQSVKAPGGGFVKIHSSSAKRQSQGGPVRVKLGDEEIRGGSALGAASIYFER